MPQRLMSMMLRSAEIGLNSPKQEPGEIYDLVNDHNLDIEIIEHGDPHLLSLGDGLREYLRFFENRLREQRKEMLGF